MVFVCVEDCFDSKLLRLVLALEPRIMKEAQYIKLHNYSSDARARNFANGIA